jgi:hypothetical protein
VRRSYSRSPAIGSCRVGATDHFLAKRFTLQRTSLQLVGDLFNVMNSNTHLVRVRNLASPNFGRLAQNLSPRILRIGVKVEFQGVLGRVRGARC